MSKCTPLYSWHQAAGARLIEFGGWQMPVQYVGVLEEHKAVRTKAGLFDLSHMGELYFRGPAALSTLQELTSNDVSQLQVGQAQYSLLCRPEGGIVDDILVYRLPDEYLMVVNAANIDKDVAWINEHLQPGVVMDNRSASTALIAIQGPLAAEILQQLTSCPLEQLYAFEASSGQVAGYEALISRTGYTGEDGFELYLAADAALPVWEELIKAGTPQGMMPIGLGARDTLRLEARLTLYGNDIDDTTSPYEAGLGYFVRLEKGEFSGSATLAAQKAVSPAKKLVAFIVSDRGIPRHGYSILASTGEVIGQVTSGTYSPTLEKDIGMGYVAAEYAAPGTLIGIDVRGKARPAAVIKGRFVPSQGRRRS